MNNPPIDPFNYTPMPPPNPLGQGFDSADKAVLPFQKTILPTHTFVVDSRQRDCRRFPDPSYYQVRLGDIYRNITSLELRGAAIPRTSYNIHSTNNKIDFAIGSSVTYINVESGGSGYLVSPNVTISPPVMGIQATANAIIDTNSGRVTSVVVVTTGSGYSPSKPPVVSIQAPENGVTATATAVVGDHYTAELRPGEYTIGGNPTPPATEPSGIIKEIQNAMNYAVNGSPYDEASTTPFEVRLVSQYPEIDADPGSPESANTNSTQFNRIQITNVDSDYWELLFCTGPNRYRSARTVLGFPWEDQINPILTAAVVTGSGSLISEGTTYRALYDYDLTDDPKFVCLSFWCGREGFERVTSAEPSLNRKFGIMLFDANSSDVIKDTTGTVEDSGGIDYLVGPVSKGSFYQAPGTMRPLKGFDFDQKKIEFPQMGKFDNLTIQFTKYGLQNGGTPEFADFEGREHLLIFQVQSSIQNQIGA